MKDILLELSKGPLEQMDQVVKDRLVGLSEKEDLKAADIKELLDDIVYSSLASGFVVVVLDGLWNMKLTEEEQNV